VGAGKASGRKEQPHPPRRNLLKRTRQPVPRRSPQNSFGGKITGRADCLKASLQRCLGRGHKKTRLHQGSELCKTPRDCQAKLNRRDHKKLSMLGKA
jgi:hypothetical protein